MLKQYIYYTAPLYSQSGRQDTVVTRPSYTAPSYHQTDDSAFYKSTQYHHHPISRPPVTAVPTPGPLYDVAAVSHTHMHQHYGNPLPHMDHHGATANTPPWATGSASYSHPLPVRSHTHQSYYQQQQQQLYQQQQQQHVPEVYNHSHQHYQVRERRVASLSID